jgi:hypothetical protein
MIGVAVLPTAMPPSERLIGFQKEHPLSSLICVTDAGHTDPSERLIPSCSHPVIWGS